MDWYASVKPYPSTLRAIRLYFNIVVRAAVLALIWGALLGIGTGLNWLIDVALGAFDASEKVKNVSLQVFSWIHRSCNDFDQPQGCVWFDTC